MSSLSKPIETNQSGPHERLVETVERHLKHPFQKPIADHSRAAFEEAQQFLATFNGAPIIFDSCCGVGDSTRWLAREFPGHAVIGVDKSAKRLGKERQEANPANMLVLRADLNDFYRLMATAGWRLVQHKIFYPNPWPKAEHLMRRWHGSPVFPDMIRLGGVIEVRSNWKLYLDEFAIALRVSGVESSVSPFTPDAPMTSHETKYLKSGHDLWCLMTDLG